MLLRAVLALGGLSFIATGIGIAFWKSCRTVVWGPTGSERGGNLSATCHDLVVQGAMSQGVAAAVSVAAGLLLLVLLAAPALLRRRVPSSADE